MESIEISTHHINRLIRIDSTVKYEILLHIITIIWQKFNFYICKTFIQKQLKLDVQLQMKLYEYLWVTYREDRISNVAYDNDTTIARIL